MCLEIVWLNFNWIPEHTRWEADVSEDEDWRSLSESIWPPDHWKFLLFSLAENITGWKSDIISFLKSNRSVKKKLKKPSVFYDWWFWRLCKDTERWSKSWDATVTTCCCCGESWYCLCINREQIHDFRAKNREIRLNASDTHTQLLTMWCIKCRNYSILGLKYILYFNGPRGGRVVSALALQRYDHRFESCDVCVFTLFLQSTHIQINSN